MQMSSTRPGFGGYASEHRFPLALLACALALAVMLAVVYGTAGFAPIWAGSAVSAVS